MHLPRNPSRPHCVATKVLSLLALAFAQAACTSSDRDPALERGSTVVLATADESGFLPTYTSLESIPFSPLLAWNQDGTREPRLARGWETSPDGRRRTYHLRTDVRWHDGEPFTARDVKFTLDLLDHPEVLGLSGAGLDSVWIVDDSTVTLVGVRPSYLDDILVYPEHVLADLNPADIWSWQFWMRPVGTGPFRSVRYVPETLMEFEANPDYFGGKPRLERLIVKFVGEGKIPELLSGNADIVDHARSEDWTQIEGDGRFLAVNVVYYSGGAMGLYLNHDHVLFSDARVRRAVALAIDRREILRALALPADIALFDVPVTPRQGRRRDFPASLPYDPGRATEILEEVGWRDSDGDGVRERNGIPARFELITRSLPRAVLVREHLRRVGLDAEILNLEPGVVEERVDLSAFDAVIHVVQDNTDWLLHHFGRDAATGYSNPRVAELLEVAAASSLDDSVDATYAAVGEVFQRDLPLIYLQPWITTQFVHRRIKGPRMPLTGNLLRQLEQLWIEEL